MRCERTGGAKFDGNPLQRDIAGRSFLSLALLCSALLCSHQVTVAFVSIPRRLALGKRDSGTRRRKQAVMPGSVTEYTQDMNVPQSG